MLTGELSREEKEKKIKWLLQNDRRSFFEILLGHYIKTPSTPVSDFHKEWFELLENEEKLLLVAPRYHAKSTIINLVDNLYDICNQKKKYIMIISDTPDQAKEHLGNIIEELESNKMLIHFYGKLYEGRKTTRGTKEKWTESEVVTTTGIKIVAKGWRLKTRGARFKEQRPDKIVLDDIENDEQVTSQTMRSKLRNIFEKKILNLGDIDATYRIVGTILHHDSLLKNELKKPREGWKVKSYRAIKEDGEPLWPEWWSKKKLMEKKKEIGSIAFSQEYLNEPIDDRERVIKNAWIRTHDLKHASDGSTVLLNNVPAKKCIGILDPAVTEKEEGSETALLTMALDDSGKMYTIDYFAEHGVTLTDLFDVASKNTRRYKYSDLLIESFSYQGIIRPYLVEQGAKHGVYFPIREIHVPKDKRERAIKASPMFENGLVYIHESHEKLINQVKEFPVGKHNDLFDCLIYGVLHFAGLLKGSAKVTSGGKFSQGDSKKPHPVTDRKKYFRKKKADRERKALGFVV